MSKLTARRRVRALTLVVVGAALALTGCARHPAAHAGTSAATGVAAATRSGTAKADPDETVATVPSGTAATPPGTLSAAPGSDRVAACPVTAETLLTALKASGTTMYARAGRPAALATPTCYGTFAVAQTVPDRNTQRSSVLFGFDAASHGWYPLNLGSADFCAGYVPADVAAHLPGCA